MKTSSSTMKDAAYGYLKKKLLDCEIPPGAAISEMQVADELEIGRTPVREAILLLQKEGLVDVFARKSTCARAISVGDVDELYQLRKIIEPTVATQFKRQIDSERLLQFDAQFLALQDTTGYDSDREFYQLDIDFHSFIVNSTDNGRLRSIFTDIMQSTYRLGIYSTIRYHNNSKRETYTEHHRIIQAVMMEDDAEIQAAFIAHINRSRMFSLKTLEAEN